MTIGIDVSLAAGEKAGVGYYVSNLVKALAGIDSQTDYLLYPFFGITCHPDFKSISVPKENNFSIYMQNESKKKIERKRSGLGIDNSYYFEDIDILHSTTYFIPESFKGKKISTIYDLSFLLFPECHTEANRLYCLQGTIDAVLQCEKLISISENTKQDLIEYFSVEPERVVVTHLAPSEIFKPVTSKKQQKLVLKKHGITKSYIFSLGSIEPRKNLARLIEAYAELDNFIQEEFDLIIAGGSGWLNSDIYSKVKALGLQKNVKFLGYVKDEELPVLYSAASLFAYPSLYEGFGLPVIEAMACGTAVVTSNNSSLKEIAKDCALLINPSDVTDIASAITKALSDNSQASKMINRGIKRAAEFSWAKTAEKTLAVYRSLGAI